MHEGEASAASWPDQAHVQRWTAALERIAARERADRGIDEPTSVVFEFGVLSVVYGDFRYAISGTEAIDDEDELFREIDYWIAFERNNGLDFDELLDRDHAVIDAWRERLPSLQDAWQEAADRVCGDVRRTTPLDWNPTVSVRETTEWFPPITAARQAVARQWVSIAPAGAIRQRRLLLPDFWLSFDRYGTNLPTDLRDVDDMTWHLAHRIQEWVIEEQDVWGAWPQCPDHGHHLDPWGDEWVCPTTRQVRSKIGEFPPT
jgi:hypothetical protein